MKYILLAFLVFFPTALQAKPSRPIIFIPGIFGSELSKNGEKLWGGPWSLNNLHRLTIISGPRKPDDAIEAKEVIRRVNLFGVFKLAEYAKTLYPILKEEGYSQEDGNLFVFPYDWRLSNFDTATKLQEFMNSPALNGKQVDMIAHSMGGLVAEIYIKKLDGAKRVKRLVDLAVPFRGSVDTLRTLTHGWGTIQNRSAGGLDVIRTFALSMPSFYELLPEYRNCCILGREQDSDRKPFNVLDANGWSQMRWLENSAALSTEGINEALHRAAEIRALAKQPYPSSVKVFYIAGAGIDTVAQFYVDRATKTISSYKFGTDRYQGDGTVIEDSASNGDISQAFVSFAEHQTVFNNESAKTSLRRILCDSCGAPDKYSSSNASAFTLNGNVLSVNSVGVATSHNYAQIEDVVTSELRIRGEGASPDKVDVKLQLAYVDEGADQVLKEVPLNGSLESPSTGLYKIEIGDLKRPGTVRIKYLIRGMATLSDYIVVLPRDK